MNIFQDTCAIEAVKNGAELDASNGLVSLTHAQLEAYSAKWALNVIESFIRLQRMAGVQTVRWTDGASSGLAFLAERIIEHRLVRPEDRASAVQILSENVVDIRPLVDERLRSVCNRDRQASEYSSDVVVNRS